MVDEDTNVLKLPYHFMSEIRDFFDTDKDSFKRLCTEAAFWLADSTDHSPYTQERIDKFLKADQQEGASRLERLVRDLGQKSCTLKDLMGILEDGEFVYLVDTLKGHLARSAERMSSDRDLNRSKSKQPAFSLIRRSSEEITSSDRVRRRPRTATFNLLGRPSEDVTVVESVSDLLPYVTDMTEHLLQLGAALGVVELTRALLNGHGTPQSKCLQILSYWLESTPSPTWALLCQKLRVASCFNAVVHKIATQHNLPTADLSQAPHPDYQLPLSSPTPSLSDLTQLAVHPSLPSSPPPPPPTWTEQYEKAIEQRGSVTLHITRCVLIGPPRVGKSSLKLLLVDNESPDQRVEKSTDLMEAPVVLTTIQCQDKKGSQWKELTPNNLQQLVSKCTREEGYNPAQLNPIQSSHTSLSTAVASDTDNVSTTVAESSNTSMHLVVSALERGYDDFVGATMSEESLAKLKMNGLKMVHVFDCGGQLAFQDTIPLLINAPCAFISVFNASIDLDEEVELKYCPEKGKELSLGHKESQWNMLRRIFSSIHSLQLKCHDDILHLIKDKTAVPSSPIAVVGTHKDVLCDSSKKHEGLSQRIEQKIKKRLEEWRESKPYDFVREKGCTLDLVANLSKDDLSAIESLCNDITESKATLSLELPLSWIILELFTRRNLVGNKFILFRDFHELCIRKKIVSHKEEFSSLLQVLHALGFYAFYQLDGVPEDENWVCTDAATLYREVTKMLVVQYKKNIKKGATIELQQYGRIKLNKATLQDVFTDLEIDRADPMWLIRVLLHIGLAVKIEVEGEEEAFIPLALPFKRSDLPPVTSVATIYFTVEFPGGASKSRLHANVTEIPRGIFPRLIVYLLSQQRSGGSGCEWKVGKGDSRSQIKLVHHSQGYFIYLSEHVDRIELDLVLNVTFLPATQHKVMRTTKVGNLCQVLREHLISALRKTFVLVFGDQPPKRKPTVVCGFKCSACRDSSHMAIVPPAEKSTPQHRLYTQCVHEQRQQYVEMADQLIWFSPVIETTFEKETTHDQNGQWTIWVMKGSDASKLGDKPSSIELLDAVIPKVAADWEVLSIRLGLEDKGRNIEKDYAKVEDRCRHVLRAWTNGEGRNPVTWETLLKVMGNCGYKDLADELAEILKRGETLEK